MNPETKNDEKNQAQEFILFILNGVFATILNFITLVIIIEVVEFKSVGFASFIASIIGLSSSYLGNRFIVFESRLPDNTSLLPFVLMHAGLASGQAVLLAIWTDHFKLSYVFGFVVATGISTAISYLVSRHMVFKRVER